jgi:hypothetical protein
MRNFQRLRTGIDTTILVNLLLRHSEYWDVDPVRTTFPGSSHVEASDILLRWGENSLDAIPAWDREPMKAMPVFKQVSIGLMETLKGVQLGRVIVTRLKPGGKIAPHIDEGLNAKFYTRTHLVLQGLPGNMFWCGGERVEMLTGEFWWFNNTQEHFCHNNSGDDRVHLIVDIRVD